MSDGARAAFRAPFAAAPTRAPLHAQFCRAVGLAAVVLVAMASGGVTAEDTRTAFRPCIDPGNLPFANDKGEGFENRIADLFAQKLGLPVQSYAFPQRMNFIRNTLRYKLPGEDFRCDIVMSIPSSFDQAWPTAPYYRSTYALVYRKGQGLDQVKSGTDLFALPADVRSKLRIGIYDNSPASAWLVQARDGSPGETLSRCSRRTRSSIPGEIIEKDLAQGKIDAAIVWGPIAGYFAKRVRNVELAVIPLRVGTRRQVRLRDRDGRPPGRARMESHGGQAHRREPGGHHGDPARVQRSAGRCARRADQLGAGLHTPVRLAPENTDANAIPVCCSSSALPRLPMRTTSRLGRGSNSC